MLWVGVKISQAAILQNKREGGNTASPLASPRQRTYPCPLETPKHNLKYVENVMFLLKKFLGRKRFRNCFLTFNFHNLMKSENGDRIKALWLRPPAATAMRRDVLIVKLEKFTIQNVSFYGRNRRVPQ